MSPKLPENLEELRRTDIEKYAAALTEYVTNLQDYTILLQERYQTATDELLDWWEFVRKANADDSMSIEQVREFLDEMILKWTP